MHRLPSSCRLFFDLVHRPSARAAQRRASLRSSEAIPLYDHAAAVPAQTRRALRAAVVARDCVVGPRGFEPPTRPLYPNVSGAYASHRLPIIARYFLERRTIGIGLRHVRRLRRLSGVDFVEQLGDQAEGINLIVVLARGGTQQLGPQVRKPWYERGS